MGARVRALAALPGVPRGSLGTIAWVRYDDDNQYMARFEVNGREVPRVFYENELGLLVERA